MGSITPLLPQRPLSDRFALVFNNALTAPFSLFISLWSVMFLEFWKSQEATLKTVWSVNDFSQIEIQRPEWKSTKYRVSLITGLKEPYFPRRWKLFRRSIAYALLTLGLLIVLLFEMVVIIFQAAEQDQKWNFFVIGVLSAVFKLCNIFLLAPCYRLLAKQLVKLPD